MRFRLLMTVLSVAVLFATSVFGTPPTSGRPPAPAAGHQKTKKYTVWFKDPDDICWRYYGTYDTRKAADVTAAEIKRVHPKWEVKITES
jgi:hypothetical protein